MTGGFVGLWLGVVATSDGRPTSSMVEVRVFEYHPRETVDG